MRARELFVPELPDGTGVVMLNATNPQHPSSVLPDEYAGGRMAVELLVTAGHTDGIALLGQNDEVERDLFRSTTVARRVSGIRDAMSDHGLSFVAEESIWLWEPEDGYVAASALLEGRDDIQALLCMNDRIAFGAYQALTEHRSRRRGPDRDAGDRARFDRVTRRLTARLHRCRVRSHGRHPARCRPARAGVDQDGLECHQRLPARQHRHLTVYARDAVPDELLDAARVDGAGEFRTFVQVALPLMRPVIVTVLLLSIVATWNNFFLPLAMLQSNRLFPVVLGIAQWQSLASANNGGGTSLWSLIVVGSLVSIIPLVIAFLTLQRYWQGGLSLGSLK